MKSRAQVKFSRTPRSWASLCPPFFFIELLADNRRCRVRLEEAAERYGFKFDSVNGPEVIEDDSTGLVEIRIRWPETPLEELHAHGWLQRCANPMVWTKRASPESRSFAVNYAWRWAGTLFCLNKLSSEALAYLKSRCGSCVGDFLKCFNIPTEWRYRTRGKTSWKNERPLKP